MNAPGIGSKGINAVTFRVYLSINRPYVQTTELLTVQTITSNFTQLVILLSMKDVYRHSLRYRPKNAKNRDHQVRTTPGFVAAY